VGASVYATRCTRLRPRDSSTPGAGPGVAGRAMLAALREARKDRRGNGLDAKPTRKTAVACNSDCPGTRAAATCSQRGAHLEQGELSSVRAERKFRDPALFVGEV